jgi:hypothetical protein
VHKVREFSEDLLASAELIRKMFPGFGPPLNGPWALNRNFKNNESDLQKYFGDYGAAVLKLTKELCEAHCTFSQKECACIFDSLHSRVRVLLFYSADTIHVITTGGRKVVALCRTEAFELASQHYCDSKSLPGYKDIVLSSAGPYEVATKLKETALGRFASLFADRIVCDGYWKSVMYLALRQVASQARPLRKPNTTQRIYTCTRSKARRTRRGTPYTPYKALLK